MLSRDKYCSIFSYLFMLCFFTIVFYFHFVAGFIAGMLIYSLTKFFSGKMEEKFKLGNISRASFVILVCLILSILTIGIVMESINFIKTGLDGQDFNLMLTKVIDILTSMKDFIPEKLSAYIPKTADIFKQQIISEVQENKKYISTLGFGFFHHFIHLIVGILIGCMFSLHQIKEAEDYPLLTRHIVRRFTNLKNCFVLVGYSQIKISAINTVLTAIYLFIILPIFGIHLPLIKTILLITFFAGLIPIVGNILSNTVMVIVSIGVSLKIGIASLLFLIVIHKIEYFLNAKIIGTKIQSIYWELIIAMIIFEMFLGLSGAISAPIIYAYIKKECKDLEIL